MNKPRKPRIAPPAKGPPQAVQRAKIIRVITERLKQFDFDDLVYIARLTAAFSALYEESDKRKHERMRDNESHTAKKGRRQPPCRWRSLASHERS